MKKATGIFLSVLLLPFIFSVAVMFVNDVVANKTEKELSAFPLPEKTQLLNRIQWQASFTATVTACNTLVSCLLPQSLQRRNYMLITLQLMNGL